MDEKWAFCTKLSHYFLLEMTYKDQIVLWLADFLRKPHIWEKCCSSDLGQKALNQSFQIEPFDHLFVFFCMKIHGWHTHKNGNGGAGAGTSQIIDCRRSLW